MTPWSSHRGFRRSGDVPDISVVIGLIFVGFLLGLLFLGSSFDCTAQHQKATIPKATAAVHQYRGTHKFPSAASRPNDQSLNAARPDFGPI